MDLWGSVPDTPSSAVSAPPSASTISVISPDSLVTHDLQNEKAIGELLPEIQKIIILSDEMCEAAWELSNFVPSSLEAHPKRIDLWKKMLIPKISQALVDDVLARNAMERSFSSIVTLANTINQSASLVRSTRGSPKSVQIARDTIKKSQDEVKACITELGQMQNSAIELFGKHAKEILEIVGPKAAEFANQEAECQTEVDTLNEKARKLINERAAAKAKVEKFNNLVHAQSVAVNGAQSAMEETKQRSGQLQAMIKAGEDAIEKIPNQIAQTTSHDRGWWFWRRSWTTTTYVQNPDKQAQVDYYTGIINARTARVQQQESNAQEVVRKQNDVLAEYKSQLDEAATNLKEIDSRISTQLSDIDAKLAILAAKIKDIRKQADDTENAVGLKGSVLIQCLSAIRNFAKANKQHLSLYEPLVSVLKYVLSLTEAPVLLLEGENVEVFAAGVALLKNVGFFHETTSRLRNANAPSQERKQLLASAQKRGMITDGADVF